MSEAKNLVYINVDVTEILRYALDDNTFIQHIDKTTALKQGTVPTTSRKPSSSTGPVSTPSSGFFMPLAKEKC